MPRPRPCRTVYIGIEDDTIGAADDNTGPAGQQIEGDTLTAELASTEIVEGGGYVQEENDADVNSRGQKKRTKEQTRATDTIDPEANPNDTFTPTGPQKKTSARVQTTTENEVESAKSELTYQDKGGSHASNPRAERTCDDGAGRDPRSPTSPRVGSPKGSAGEWDEYFTTWECLPAPHGKKKRSK